MSLSEREEKTKIAYASPAKPFFIFSDADFLWYHHAFLALSVAALLSCTLTSHSHLISDTTIFYTAEEDDSDGVDVDKRLPLDKWDFFF
jgi:hypothetical protein